MDKTDKRIAVVTDNDEKAHRITEAVSTETGIEAEKVKIIEMKP